MSYVPAVGVAEWGDCPGPGILTFPPRPPHYGRPPRSPGRGPVPRLVHLSRREPNPDHFTRFFELCTLHKDNMYSLRDSRSGGL